MQNKKNKQLNKKGFTLLELLLVLAIIVILSGVILVSVGSQRKKARETKMLTELSATLQPILMCYSDGGTIEAPTSGENICSLGDSYGKWPSLPDDFTENGNKYSSDFSGSNWYFFIENDNVQICCNNYSGRCGLQSANDECNGKTSIE